MGMPDFLARRRAISQSLKGLRGGQPTTMKAWGELYQASMAEGALSAKHKELMALAIGVAAGCDGCITFHVRDALGAGASRAEVEEALGVAIMMGGGPSVMHAADAHAALEQYEADGRG